MVGVHFLALFRGISQCEKDGNNQGPLPNFWDPFLTLFILSFSIGDLCFILFLVHESCGLPRDE